MVSVESLGEHIYKVRIEHRDFSMLDTIANRFHESCADLLAMVIVRGLIEYEEDFQSER